MQVLTVILMLLSFAFMVWGVVSLVRAVISKVKAKKKKALAESGAVEDSEKGD